MVTRTTPCLANGPPDAPGKAPEPPTNPPPWIHTITGSLRGGRIGGAPDVQEQAILRRHRRRGRTRGRRRSESSLHAVRPELRGLAHARPPRRRLGRPPAQVADGRRREGNALEGDDSVVDHALQFAGIHPHDCRRLRTRRGANTRRGRQRGQRAHEKSGHPRNRRGSVVTFCAHTSPFACQHDRRVGRMVGAAVICKTVLRRRRRARDGRLSAGYRPAPAASPSARRRAVSFMGALPKKRAYSRLNCDGLR